MTRKPICKFVITNLDSYLKEFSFTLAALKWFSIFATNTCCHFSSLEKLFADIIWQLVSLSDWNQTAVTPKFLCWLLISLYPTSAMCDREYVAMLKSASKHPLPD